MFVKKGRLMQFGQLFLLQGPIRPDYEITPLLQYDILIGEIQFLELAI